jgi:hypothetical protein
MPRGDLLKGNSHNVIGGAGMLAVVPYNAVSAPQRISDVIDLKTLELKGPWRTLGFTTDGISQTRGFDTEDTEVDQRTAPIDTTVTGTTNNISTTLMEDTMLNRQLANIGSEIEEIPAVLGTPTTLAADVSAGATNFKVASAADIEADSYVQLGGVNLRVSKVDTNNNIVYLKERVAEAFTAATEVTPVEELATSRIAYGTISSVPEHSLVLLSETADGRLYMAYFYRVQVSGDDKERNFDKSKRQFGITFNAYSEDGLPEGENVYFELEQTV